MNELNIYLTDCWIWNHNYLFRSSQYEGYAFFMLYIRSVKLLSMRKLFFCRVIRFSYHFKFSKDLLLWYLLYDFWQGVRGLLVYSCYVFLLGFIGSFYQEYIIEVKLYSKEGLFDMSVDKILPQNTFLFYT